MDEICNGNEAISIAMIKTSLHCSTSDVYKNSKQSMEEKYCEVVKSQIKVLS